MATIEAVRAGVDWLTLTLPRNAPRADLWYLTCVSALHLVETEGNKPKERKLLGYYGRSVGGCFVGERQQDYMAQFSSHHADAVFSNIYRSDAHVSRIDIRADVTYPVMPLDIARKGYRDAIRANNELPLSRRRKLYLLVGSDGGDTLYLGSPTSESRGRLYNKEVQSKHDLFMRTWRYEVILRNNRAVRAAEILFSRGESYSGAALGIVATWYASRGVSVRGWGGGEEIPINLARTISTDIDTRLEWLRRQVAPALRYLEEAGYTNELAEALGIMKRSEESTEVAR